MTDEERRVIVQLIDDCKARNVRHFKRGGAQGLIEFTLDREAKPAPARLSPLSRVKASEA